MSTRSATPRSQRLRKQLKQGAHSPKRIEGLSFAWLLNARPSYIPMNRRPTGSRAEGLSYERKVVRELKNRFPQVSWIYHQWLGWTDRNGSHECEPELYVVLKDCVLLFEVKRTGRDTVLDQLALYAELLAFIYRRPVRSCLVCKWTSPSTPGPFYETPEAFIASGKSFGTWHWLG